MFRSTSAKLFLLAAAGLIGCAAGQPDSAAPAPQPVFDPAVFFAGRTRGEATLKVVLKRAEPVHVEGRGRVTQEGTLILDQTVARGGRAPETRQWRIRSAGGGRVFGSLSDATGPVTGEIRGNMLHLRYPMKGGVDADQRIYLQPGGRTALNRMTISKFGLTVGRLDETIRKLD
ncbi:MAG TPA: DUF3833 family protein [Sphingomonas sp.]|nr:DUF3833 family protein [Sphingomonas sp.]